MLYCDDKTVAAIKEIGDIETDKQEMDKGDAYDFILSFDVGYIVLDGIFLELSNAIEITESN